MVKEFRRKVCGAATNDQNIDKPSRRWVNFPIVIFSKIWGAFPSASLAVGYRGELVYHQAFGKFTYSPNATDVNVETIYDLASLTKVSATLQTVMFMVEKGLIDINKKASVYLPELRESNKKDFYLIHNNSRRLLRLINQLLDYRKIEEKKFNFNPSLTNVVSFSKQICSIRY